MVLLFTFTEFVLIMQVYLSLYTMLGCVADQVSGGASMPSDSLFIPSLKVISAVLALSSIALSS